MSEGPLYLGSPVWRARAVVRSKVDGIVPHTQQVNLRTVVRGAVNLRIVVRGVVNLRIVARGGLADLVHFLVVGVALLMDHLEQRRDREQVVLDDVDVLDEVQRLRLRPALRRKALGFLFVPLIIYHFLSSFIIYHLSLFYLLII